MDKAIKFLEDSKISKDDYIIVGCSGGPDSMCLLNLLKDEGYKTVCAHVNHKIRKESDNEYKFLKKYCNNNNIIFEGTTLEPEENQNESYYRKKRYGFYKLLTFKYNTKYIATAHHGDDLIETILMRISRGSNLKGYIGFNKLYHEKNYIFIKPLIFYTKNQILEYNENNNIPFVIDKTNEEDNYTRNRYRHHILPFLKSENSLINEKYLNFSAELSETNDFINKIVNNNYVDNYKNGVIDLNKFKRMDLFIQKKELELIFSEIYQNSINKVNRKHIDIIIESINKEHNFKLNLPENLVIKKEYNYLYFTFNEFVEAYNYTFNNNLDLPNGYLIKKIDDTNKKSNNVIRLNSQDIKLPLIVRTKFDGDYINIKHMDGTKKISKIFIDNKINSRERTSWPIVTDSNNIVVWVPGLRKSKFDMEKTEKYDIILKYERKEYNNEKK